MLKVEGINIKDKIIVGIAGMPGSGKGVFRNFIKRSGNTVIIMGDLVRDEVKRRNLRPTPENMGKIMLHLRESEGPAVVAKRCVQMLKNVHGEIVGVDGIRSLAEVEEFKKHFPNFILIAIHASPKTRYSRLYQRNRSDDPKSWTTFIERDLRELQIGMGSVIATADNMILNEKSLDNLENEIRKLFRRLLKR